MVSGIFGGGRSIGVVIIIIVIIIAVVVIVTTWKILTGMESCNQRYW